MRYLFDEPEAYFMASLFAPDADLVEPDAVMTYGVLDLYREHIEQFGYLFPEVIFRTENIYSLG